MRKDKTKVIILLLVGVCLSLLVSLLWDHNDDANRSGLAGVSLVKPALAQESSVSFLEDEAGISAYTLSDKKIDLKKARNAFKLVEKETDKYVIGSFSLSGYKQYDREDIRLFVHADGWVVVYYMKEDPTAKMIVPQNPGTTKLAMALNEACGLVGATIPYADLKQGVFHWVRGENALVLVYRES